MGLSDEHNVDVDISDTDMSFLLSDSSSDQSCWWERKALEISCTSKDPIVQRLAQCLFSCDTNEPPPWTKHEGLPDSFDFLDAGGMAEFIDHKICAAMCTIPFEHWVRTALHHDCDSVATLIHIAFVIRNQLSQKFGASNNPNDLYKRIEDVGFTNMNHVIR